jgi:hypothetical protein
MLAYIRQAQRLWILDQHAEHTAAARQRTDLAMRLRVDPDSQEALELTALLVEDPQRRVARPGQLASLLQDPLQHGLEVELGDDRAPDLQDTPQTAFVKHSSSKGTAAIAVVPERVAYPGLLEAGGSQGRQSQGGHRMKLHANAALSLNGRRRMVAQVIEQGRTNHAGRLGGRSERPDLLEVGDALPSRGRAGVAGSQLSTQASQQPH